MKKTMMFLLSGSMIGLLNGLFGSGGGIAAVLILKGVYQLKTERAHATALLIILPLSVLSLILYLRSGEVPVGTALSAGAGGIFGGITGALLLKKLSPVWITRLFGGMMIAAAIRLFVMQ